MSELINNLKSDLESKIKNALEPVKSDIAEVKGKIENVEARLSFIEKKEKRKNVIVHGFPDNNDIPRVLRNSVIKSFGEIMPYEDSGINFNSSIVYAKRLE